MLDKNLKALNKFLKNRMMSCYTRLKCTWSCKCFLVRNRSIKSRRSKIFHIPSHPMTLLSVGEIEKSCGALPTTCVAILGYTRFNVLKRGRKKNKRPWFTQYHVSYIMTAASIKSGDNCNWVQKSPYVYHVLPTWFVSLSFLLLWVRTWAPTWLWSFFSNK